MWRKVTHSSHIRSAIFANSSFEKMRLLLDVGVSANTDVSVNAYSIDELESTQAISSLSGGGVTIGIVLYGSLSRVASRLHTANMHCGSTKTNMTGGLDSTHAEDVNARITVRVDPLATGGILTNTKVQKTLAKPTARITRSAAAKKVGGAHRGPENEAGRGGTIVNSKGDTMKIRNGISVVPSGLYARMNPAIIMQAHAVHRIPNPTTVSVPSEVTAQVCTSCSNTSEPRYLRTQVHRSSLGVG